MNIKFAKYLYVYLLVEWKYKELSVAEIIVVNKLDFRLCLLQNTLCLLVSHNLDSSKRKFGRPESAHTMRGHSSCPIVLQCKRISNMAPSKEHVLKLIELLSI